MKKKLLHSITAIVVLLVAMETNNTHAQEYSTGPLLTPAEATARLTPEEARQTEAYFRFNFEHQTTAERITGHFRSGSKAEVQPRSRERLLLGVKPTFWLSPWNVAV